MSPKLRSIALGAALMTGFALAPRPAAAVVGGSEAPSALAVSAVMVLSSRGGMCSGIVVALDAVLTAGHCVAGGESRVHWRDGGSQPLLIAPAAVAIHPGYDPAAIKARRRSVDLALVRLPSPLPGGFKPATLAAAPAAKGASVLLGGFGVARENDARSSGTFRTASLSVAEPYGPSRVLLWVSDPDGRSGPCTGDSGGPIVDGSGSVVAVTTWSSGPGRSACGGMSQGVLVGPERAWLDRTLAGWGSQVAWR